MKKIIYLSLACSILFACGSNNNSGEEQNEGTQGSQQQEEQMEQPASDQPMNPAEKNLKEGKEFLEANKEKEGVKVLPSGLQYKVLKEGSGKKPGPTDVVKVHYKGTLINGTTFSTSYGGDPLVSPLNNLIAGWQEGIQLMSEDSKYILYIPHNLAYGERGTPGGPVPPNATLIFEVELLEVK